MLNPLSHKLTCAPLNYSTNFFYIPPLMHACMSLQKMATCDIPPWPTGIMITCRILEFIQNVYPIPKNLRLIQTVKVDTAHDIDKTSFADLELIFMAQLRHNKY
jgi:hypothetical protein